MTCNSDPVVDSLIVGLSNDVSAPVLRSGFRDRHRWSAIVSVAGIVAGSAVLNLWALTSVGWGNAYYSAAARSMGTSWKSFFFASFDSGNFVSVDKPPLSLWVQVASAKLFGYSQFSLLLPEALAGTAAVLLLYVGIRRSWGHTATGSAGTVDGLSVVRSPVVADAALAHGSGGTGPDRRFPVVVRRRVGHAT